MTQPDACDHRQCEMHRRNRLLYSVPGHKTKHLTELELTPCAQLALLLYHLPEVAKAGSTH